jgi:hypothetical protein
MLLQAAFDLAQLDAETADLHLMVGRPTYSTRPSARRRTRSPVRYRRPPSAAERVGDEALGAHARRSW